MDAEQARTELLDERQRFEQVAGTITQEQSERETEQAGLPGQHAPDQGVDTADWLDDQGMRADAGRQIEEIDAALARIADGTWGTCEVCGRESDAERLEARPRAVRCLEHQEQAERAR